jgi:glycosyltransferase involved in cell wall biosynthesis
MKKIFWGIQQLDRVGGTETVSIQLMNMLCDYYEIHMVVTSTLEDKICYYIDPRIKIHYLDVPSKLGRFDQYWKDYSEKHQIINKIKLFNTTLYHYLFLRNKYRKKIASLMGKDDIYIGSSVDSYYFMPKGKRNYYHFHFDSNSFLSPFNKAVRLFCPKIEKYIFLTNSTLNKVLSANKKIAAKSRAIYNPIRFEPKLNLDYHNNTIIFVGRYTEQKNPMFALQVALELDKKGFQYNLNMYGDGHLEKMMKEFVLTNNLKNVHIYDNHKVSETEYQNADLLLLTSSYEGFGLVVGEACSQSTPVISTKWDGPIDEIVVNKENGIVIDSSSPSVFADEIVSLLNDKERLIQYKQSAFDFVKRFSKEEIVKKWREILD